MQVTQWFPGDVTPVHTGVYERKHLFELPYPLYSFWNGHRWGQGCGTPTLAEHFQDRFSGYPSLLWRGIAK